MKRVIKYFYLGFWEPINFLDWINCFLSPIKEKYIFVEDSINPEFVFYSCFLDFADLQKFPTAIKIFLSGENVSPDFTYFDYWTGPDFLTFQNRYFQLPEIFWVRYEMIVADPISFNKKKYFCDFCYSHDRDNMLRKKLYEKFSEYKKVVNSGMYLNKNFNISGNRWDYKLSIQKLCKFSLVIESTDMDGFITEKLAHALESNTIPIYFGTDKVFYYFNKKRIIYGYDFNSLDDLLNYVIEIDNNGALYKQILSQHIYNSNFNVRKYKQKFADFFSNIFDKKIKYCETQFRPAYFMKDTIRKIENSNLKRSCIFKRVINRIYKCFSKH